MEQMIYKWWEITPDMMAEDGLKEEEAEKEDNNIAYNIYWASIKF